MVAKTVRAHRRLLCHVAPLSVFAVLVAGGVEAQESLPPRPISGAELENVVSYPASYFSQSRPATAFDMVRRTPGFSYNAGDGDTRGLSGAAGNVLIDGQVQTSKQVTLDDVLERIPASQVERIDVVRAGAGGIDMTGFAVVANIVRTAAGARSEIVVQVEPRIYADKSPADGSVRVDWSRRADGLVLSAAAFASAEHFDEGGRSGRLVRMRPDGTVFERGSFVADHHDERVGLNGALEYRAGETLYRANFGYEHRRSDRNEKAYLSTLEWFVSEEEEEEEELGANIERKLGPALTAKIDALQTYSQELGNAGRFGATDATEATGGESNLRAALVYRPSEDFGVEASAEGAFNFLDQTSALEAANANVRVEELRVQPSITTNWQITAPLALELGARYERSTISQSGDTNAERTLGFFKPRAIVAFDALERTQLRFRVERVVQQLNFEDFAASSGPDDASRAGGNASLQPERSWLFEAAVEQRLWPRSAIVVSYTHEDVKETLDYVPLGPSADGRGNIGQATRDTFTADIKISLDALGLRGVRVEGNPQYYLSEAIDPFTGRSRFISGRKFFRGRTSVYLDRPEINSTFAIEIPVGMRALTYRLSQEQVVAQQTFWNAWWEWTPSPGWAFRTTVNYIGRERERHREVYIGSRALNRLGFREDRSVFRDAVFGLRIRKRL